MALKVGELNVQINLNVQRLNDDLKSVEKAISGIGDRFKELNNAAKAEFDQIRNNVGTVEEALKRLQNVQIPNLNTAVRTANKTSRPRAPSQKTVERLQTSAAAYERLDQAASAATNAQIAHLTRFETAARASHGRIAESAKNLAEFRINESLRVLNATKEHFSKINNEFKEAANFQKQQIREVTTEYLESQRQIAGFFSRMNRSGGRRFTKAAAPITEQIEPTGQIQPARGVLNRLNVVRDPFSKLTRSLDSLNETIARLNTRVARGALSGGGRTGGGGRGGSGFGGLFDSSFLTGGGYGLPRFGGLAGIGASLFGIIGVADLFQNLAYSMREFTVETITMSNELERTSYSAEIVSGNFAKYSDLLDIAKNNQRLFGGTLSENIQELTGFSLVARTAGVDLEMLTGVAQRLALFDPGQGIGGASTALREYLSGNIRSLRERFELPANVLRALQSEGLSTTQKLERLSLFLDSQGLSLENLAERLNTTSQSYRDLGIAVEEFKINAGQDLAEFFKPVADFLTVQLNRFNKDIEQLARDMNNLSLQDPVDKAQMLAAQMENARLRTEEYRNQIELSRADMAKLVAEQSSLTGGMGGESRMAGGMAATMLMPPEIPKNAEIAENAQLKLNVAYEQTQKILEKFPEASSKIDVLYAAFSEADTASEGALKLSNGIAQLYNELIIMPESISRAQQSINGMLDLLRNRFTEYRSEITTIVKMNPKLAISVNALMNSFASGTITAEAFEIGLANLRKNAELTGIAVDALNEEVKSVSLQFIEAELQSYATEKAQRQLTDAMTGFANASSLTAGQITMISNLLGVERGEVYGLVAAYKELAIARSFGIQYADEIDRLSKLGLSPDIVKALTNRVLEQGYADLTMIKLQVMLKNLQKLKKNITARL